MFAPVPWALGIYFLFTVVRLILAHGRHLPPWMVTLSVIIDMAGLLITIWSFHLQYQQEPGFSLKAPTLLYIFILIALRTLRFDARYVILAGASAMAGWLGLLSYALANSPMPGVISYAAEALLEAQDAWNQERADAGEPAIAAGVGVAVGTVVFGAVGDDSRLEYTVIGDAVNLAAKLERHTKVEPARALTTGASLEIARSQGYSAGAEPEIRPGRQVAGVEYPIDLVVLAV